MGYSIKVLSNKDFDNLPYSQVRRAMGVADPKSNTAYIRHTSVSKLNNYLIDHEFDHLVEEIPTDEHEGVRYKITDSIMSGLTGLGSMVKNIAPTAIGYAMGGPMGAAAGNTLFNSNGSGFGIPVPKGQTNFLPSSVLASQNAKNGLAMAGPLGMASNVMSSFQPQAQQPSMANMLSYYMPPGINGQATIPQAQTAYANPAQQTQAPKPAPYQPPAQQPQQQQYQPQPQQPAPQQPPPAPPTQQQDNKGLLDSFTSSMMTALGLKPGQTVADLIGEKVGGTAGGVLNQFSNPATATGTGLLAAGVNKELPKVPDLPQSAENLRSTINSGGTPLSQQAKTQLSTLMSQQFNPMSEPEIQAATRQLEMDQMKAEDRVRDLYRNLRPGTDPSTDSAFRRDLQEVQNQFAQAKADTLANRTRDLQTNFNSQRMQQIQSSLGASNQDIQYLTQLANMDIEQIMAQLQIDYAAAQHFKETFTQLGSNMLQIGAMQSSPMSGFNVINLGR